MTNLQGDATAILDSTGAVMVNYHYDAYGVLLQTGGTTATTLGALNPLTYRGYVYDHETGLYYLQSRYYNPTIRQFISADAYLSTGQGSLGYNMFAYCGNNPVIYSDPTGKFWDIVIDILSLIDSIGSVAEDPGDWKNEAYYKADQYVAGLERMRKGLAPIGDDGLSMHLHHPYGRNGDFYYVFEPVTYTDHMQIHYGGK